MAVTSGFFDSLDHDRVYTADEFSSLFDGLISDGIYENIGGALKVVTGTGMQVKVRTGRAWFNHIWVKNDRVLNLEIAAAPVSGQGDRIDAIVVEIDKSSAVRNADIKVIQGEPASTPVRPTLSHSGTLFQYALAYVTIVAASTSIPSNKIADVRASETGMIKAIIGVDTSDADISSILSRLNALEAAASTYWTKSQLQFATSGTNNTTLNITVNENA